MIREGRISRLKIVVEYTVQRSVTVPAEPTSVSIARELLKAVRSSPTIDRTLRENVRAQMRVRVKRYWGNTVPA